MLVTLTKPLEEIDATEYLYHYTPLLSFFSSDLIMWCL